MSVEAPSWESVKVPQTVVEIICDISGSSSMLDRLVSHLVFRRLLRKVIHRLICPNCDYECKTSQIDTVSQCEDCGNYTLHSVPSTEMTKRPKSFITGNYKDVIEAMELNFHSYFHYLPRRLIDCGWEDGIIYCQFSQGYKVKEVVSRPRMAILKAAVLCPYLWDTNWKPKDGVTTKFSQIIRLLCG